MKVLTFLIILIIVENLMAFQVFCEVPEGYNLYKIRSSPGKYTEKDLVIIQPKKTKPGEKILVNFAVRYLAFDYTNDNSKFNFYINIPKGWKVLKSAIKIPPREVELPVYEEGFKYLADIHESKNPKGNY